MVKFNKFTSITAGEDHKLLLKCLLPKILHQERSIIGLITRLVGGAEAVS